MQKKLPAILILFLWSAGNALAFSDVPKTSRYNSAIDYLSISGIINGYPDGTFKPDNNINRAEFLKIALGSSGIISDALTPTGFSDVDEDAWYAPYLRKAKAQQWVDGYPDGTFKPDQFINKAEALKIVAKIQGWKTKAPSVEPYRDTPMKAWFTPYVLYAKEKNFLEEQGTSFTPDAMYSRAKISEMLMRSYVTAISGEDTYSPDLLQKFPPQQKTTTPVPSSGTSSGSSTTNQSGQSTQGCPTIAEVPEEISFSMIEKDFFSNITLDEPFPNIFYKNEVYLFEGSFIQNGKTYSKAFVFLVQPNGICQRFPVTVEDHHFSIPVFFRTSGNFKLGLILGNSGASKVVDISVLPQLPEPSASITEKASSPLQPDIEYQDMATRILWKPNGNNLTEITVSQEQKKKTFLSRQTEYSFPIDYTDFSGFKNGSFTISMRSATLDTTFPMEMDSKWSDPVEKDFISVTHQFTGITAEALTLSTKLPEELSAPQKITINATANVDIFQDAAVIKPDGFVTTFSMKSSTEEEYFGSTIIPAGSTFTFEYEAAVKGTYILEINGTDGSAVLNVPVYIGNGVPLTPNFFDLNRYNQYEYNFNLENARITMLDLINSERKLHGLNPVVIDENLNKLAQLHSEDMLEREFFGHINPDGQSPNDRRKELSITASVGENLAMAPTILYSHNGLMQSAIHRKNILEPSWTKVGIGMVQDTDGTLITTQEFSGEALTEKNLETITRNIFTEINKVRAAENLMPVTENVDLVTAAESWSNKMATQNFFNFVSPNGETLSGIVNWYAPNKAVQALILESGNEEKLLEKILESSEITDSQWSTLGLGLALDSIGMIKTTLLFSGQ